MPYLFVILGAVFLGNLCLLVSRRKKVLKDEKQMQEERAALKTKHAAIQRRLHYEQEEAARRVDLQNKTLEMFEQCRKNAEMAEHSSDAGDD